MRQRQVIEALSRRRTIKQVANELAISPSRVSQYVRTLKDLYGVETLADLADIWNDTAPAPCNKESWNEKQVPEPDGEAHGLPEIEAGLLRFRDAAVLPLTAPWRTSTQHRVGPGLLDGPGAKTRRVIFILIVAIGLPVVVVVTLSAMIALTEVLRSLA